MTNWHNYLQQKTRTPAFLWRMVLGILVAGRLVENAAGGTTIKERNSKCFFESAIDGIEDRRCPRFLF